jgi:hypothetical protein
MDVSFYFLYITTLHVNPRYGCGVQATAVYATYSPTAVL